MAVAMRHGSKFPPWANTGSRRVALSHYSSTASSAREKAPSRAP
jgi:hypothetical protein